MTDIPVPPVGRYHCPACGALMLATAACPQCGRGADPQAPRLMELATELTALARRIEASRSSLDELTDLWQAGEAERRELSRAMVTAVFAERAAAAQVSAGSRVLVGAGAPMPSGSAPGTERPAMPWAGTDRLGTSDATPRTVQNLLFVLGGVLLGIGAIVFTVVAWARYGMVGRVSILAIATLIALTIPVIAQRRKLAATAETFTAIGLLLVALDGYGAHRLDLFGLAGRFSGTTFAALVLAVVAAVGLAYGFAFDLGGPKIVAVVALQPILPLLIASHRPGLTLVAAAYAGLTAIDFAIAKLCQISGGFAALGGRAEGLPGVTPSWILSLILGGLSLTFATFTSLAALIGNDGFGPAARAAAVVVGCAVLLFLVTALRSNPVLRGLGVAVAVLEVETAIAYAVGTLWHDHRLFIVSAVTAATVALAVWLSGVMQHRGRARIDTGVVAAGWTSIVFLGAVSMGAVAYRVIRDLALVAPVWHSNLAHLNHAGTVPPSVPVSITVAFLAASALSASAPVGKTHRAPVALLGGAPLVLSLASLGGQWWTPPVVDVVGIVALLIGALVFVRRQDRIATGFAGAGALVLAVHASTGSLVRPALTATILGSLVVIGCAAVAAFWQVPDRDRTATTVAGSALVTALLALPIAVASLAEAYATGPVAPMRFGLGAAAFEAILLLGIRRLTDLRWYATGAVTAITIAVSVTPLAYATDERLNLYAMTGRLIIALAILAIGLRGRVARIAAIPGDLLGLLAFGRIVPLVATVVVAPYAWLGSIWSGAPHGVGIAPNSFGVPIFGVHIDTLDILTAVLFTASIAASGALLRGRRGAIAFGVHPAVIAVLVILAAAATPWPALPIVALGLGAVAVLTSTLIRRDNPTAMVGWTGLLVAGAGLSGLMVTRTSSLYGLGAVTVVALVVGAAGRSPALRAAGWASAIVAGDLLVNAAIRAHGAGAGTVALGLLGVAALASVAAPLIGRLNQPESQPQSAPESQRENQHEGQPESQRESEPETQPARERHGRSRVEVAAIDAVAHGTAFVALVTASSLTHAAICAAGWGLLVAIRAMWPDVPTNVRRALIAGGVALELVAWWLVAIERHVHLIDAYTLPAAAVALVAGWLAARSRPELNSWTTYGTALIAAFLPSLAPTFGNDASDVRRLVLGVTAVLVVLIGAQTRLQAPVVVGGATTVLLALQQLVRAWQHLPAWVPLTAAGLLIIVVASTYERRRRDWSRLRGAMARLS